MISASAGTVFLQGRRDTQPKSSRGKYGKRAVVNGAVKNHVNKVSSSNGHIPRNSATALEEAKRIAGSTSTATVTLGLQPCYGVIGGDSDPAESDDSNPMTEQDITPDSETPPDNISFHPAPQKARRNVRHMLNFYTPTILSPILDVSPSLEDQEALPSMAQYSAEAGRPMSWSVDDMGYDQVADETSAAASTLLKRSPATFDFACDDMSKSMVELDELNRPELTCAPCLNTTIVVPTAFSTEMSRSMDENDARFYGLAFTTLDAKCSTSASQHTGHLPRSSLLTDDLSIPFYFTSPQPTTTSSESPLAPSASHDSLLNRPHYKGLSVSQLLVGGATTPRANRMSYILSRMLLKEELREAMYLQRSKLAACEIEADERAAKLTELMSRSRRRGSDPYNRNAVVNGRCTSASPSNTPPDRTSWYSEPTLCRPESIIYHTPRVFRDVGVQTDMLRPESLEHELIYKSRDRIIAVRTTDQRKTKRQSPNAKIIATTATPCQTVLTRPVKHFSLTEQRKYAPQNIDAPVWEPSSSSGVQTSWRYRSLKSTTMPSPSTSSTSAEERHRLQRRQLRQAPPPAPHAPTVPTPSSHTSDASYARRKQQRESTASAPSPRDRLYVTMDECNNYYLLNESLVRSPQTAHRRMRANRTTSHHASLGRQHASNEFLHSRHRQQSADHVGGRPRAPSSQKVHYWTARY